LGNPAALIRALNVKKYGIQARSFRTVFWAAPFLGKHFDVVHCHFGPIANNYLVIREVLGSTEPMVTTFYGYDVSHIPKEKGVGVYDALRRECSQFLVMSENMKERVTLLGFPKEQIMVLPISIDVESYPYAPRRLEEGEPVRIVSVGRFVEKKGFDDLLKTIALVKEKTKKRFVLEIVGDGPLRENLHGLAKELGIIDVVDFKGFMKLQDVIQLYTTSDLYVQASKTAADGDME
jgi:colanic acid/amylovoran biosynthesis glycosyltransferase